MRYRWWDTFCRSDGNQSLIPYSILLLNETLALLWILHGLYKVILDGKPTTEKFFCIFGISRMDGMCRHYADLGVQCD